MVFRRGERQRSWREIVAPGFSRGFFGDSKLRARFSGRQIRQVTSRGIPHRSKGRVVVCRRRSRVDLVSQEVAVTVGHGARAIRTSQRKATSGVCRPLKRAANIGPARIPPVETGGYDLKPASPAFTAPRPQADRRRLFSNATNRKPRATDQATTAKRAPHHGASVNFQNGVRSEIESHGKLCFPVIDCPSLSILDLTPL